jgi:trehalose synthase-fused probable maltokinase
MAKVIRTSAAHEDLADIAFWRCIEPALPTFIEQQRWFATKTMGIETAVVISALAVSEDMALVIVNVTNKNKTTEQYALPLKYSSSWQTDDPNCICELATDSSRVAVLEASKNPEFWRNLLRQSDHSNQEFLFHDTFEKASWSAAELASWQIEIHSGEQSNTSVVLGDEFFLKLFRRVIPGNNPDVEIGQFLAAEAGFSNAPAVVKTLEWTAEDADAACILMISERVECESDAWTFALGQLDQFWQRVLKSPQLEAPRSIDWNLDSLEHAIDTDVVRLVGRFLDDAKLLGRRTRDLHLALSRGSNAAFGTTAINEAEIRRLVTNIEQEVTATAELLTHSDLETQDLDSLANRLKSKAQEFLATWKSDSGNFSTDMIRIHGDYHLGQVLRTSSDFFIIDFEGEPDRDMAERREKRSPMKDVAGMIRSLHYASNAASVGLISSLSDVDHSATIDAWQMAWFQASAHAFLNGYFHEQETAPWRSEYQRLLDLFLLEKTLYEIRYEINNRPDWVQIPLRGLIELLSL